MRIFNGIEKQISFFRLVALMICLFAQSCANSQIGNRLSNSFDDPILSPKEPEIKQEIKDDIPQNNRKRNQITQEYERKEFDLKNKKPSLSTKKSNRINSIFNRDNTQFEPQSYRLILILRGVNPSAPSEFVTRALIEEGIQFEVERIERFKDEGAQKRLPSKRNEF